MVRPPTRAEVMTLARMASSKQGLNYRTAAPANRHLTKKDINDWRNAHQVALDYENPNRQGFMTFMPM